MVKLFSLDFNNTSNLKYSATPIRFFSNFLKVFEASHSINFLISLFGQLDFECDDYNQRQIYFENLCHIITKLIEKSPIICEQMNVCHMYSVISYFLYQGSKEHLTLNVWNSFIEQLHLLKDNEPLRNMLGKWIIFHNDIWCRAPLAVQIKVYNDWNMISKEEPDYFNQFVTFQFLLTIYNSLVQTDENMQRILDCEYLVTKSNPEHIEEKLENIRNIILLLCQRITIKSGDNEDSVFLYETLWNCPVYDQTLGLLTLGGFCISQPWFHLHEFHFGTSWMTVFTHPSDRVRSLFMDLFAKLYQKEVITEDYIRIALYYVSCYPLTEKTEEDNSVLSMLINCCKLSLENHSLNTQQNQNQQQNSQNPVVSSSPPSSPLRLTKRQPPIQHFEEIDFAAVHNREGISLMKLIQENKQPIILTPIMIHFAFAAAIVSSESVNNVFIEFLKEVCKNEQNISQILSNISLYTQFLIVLWGAQMYRTNEDCIKIIALFATYNKAQLLRHFLDILDALSGYWNLDDFLVKLIQYSFDIVKKQELDQEMCQTVETLVFSLLFHSYVYNSPKLKEEFMKSPFYTKTDEKENNETQDNDDNYPNTQRETVIPGPKEIINKFLKRTRTELCFSKRIDENCNWLDFSLCKELAFFLNELNNKFPNSVYQLLIILISQFINKDAKEEDYKEFIPILINLVDTIEKSDDFIVLI